MQIDDDDIYVRPVTRGRSNAEWVGIIVIGVTIGILMTDGLKLLAVNAWARHQMAQFEQASREAQSKAQERANEVARKQNEQARQRAYEVKFNSNECRFWRDMNRQNPSEKTRSGLAQHCP